MTVQIINRKAVQALVARARRRGDLVPSPCETCGKSPTCAHHEDYSKPLEVIWLCKSCHSKLHGLRKHLEKVAWWEAVPRIRRAAFPVCELRTHLGLTQVELATRLGVLPISVRDWELGWSNPGERSDQALRALADQNGIKVTNLKIAKE